MSNTSPGWSVSRLWLPATGGSPRLRYGRFPYRRTVEDFDFEFQPSVNPKMVEDLASLRFIEENRPVLFLGQPG